MRKLVTNELAASRGKVKSLMVFFTLIVVTLAQWNGARLMLESVYTNFITHFTHHIEYRQLEHVRIGANLTYLESIFGAAQLIKTSSTDPSLTYRYYHSNKFLLTLGVKEDSIEGFQLVSLRPSFQPTFTLSDLRLNDTSFSQQYPYGNEFVSDTGNLRFYLEAHQLGRVGLFMNLYPAYVSYGASKAENPANRYAQHLDDLNHAYLLGEDEEMARHQADFRLHATPNTYSFGRISLETAADMLLTNYEFRAYFE